MQSDYEALYDKVAIAIECNNLAGAREAVATVEGDYPDEVFRLKVEIKADYGVTL